MTPRWRTRLWIRPCWPQSFDPLILDGDEPIEEPDAVEVLLSWKQTRTNINKEEIARGFPSGGPVQGRCEEAGGGSAVLQVQAGWAFQPELSEKDSGRKWWYSWARWTQQGELGVHGNAWRSQEKVDMGAGWQSSEATPPVSGLGGRCRRGVRRWGSTEQPMADEMEEPPDPLSGGRDRGGGAMGPGHPRRRGLLGDEAEQLCHPISPDCTARHVCPLAVGLSGQPGGAPAGTQNDNRAGEGEKAEEINDWTDPATARIHVGQRVLHLVLARHLAEGLR